MSLNLIEIFKLTVYDTQNTQNTKIHFHEYNFFRHIFFQKTDIHSNQSVSPHFVGQAGNYLFKLFPSLFIQLLPLLTDNMYINKSVCYTNK